MTVSPEIQKLKEQAAALRKSQDYAQALSIFETLWTSHREDCNEWDGWGYAFCLRKQKQSKLALEVCREVRTLKPEFEYNNSLYGWCLYDVYVAAQTPDQIAHHEAEFLGAAKEITALTKPEKFSPYVLTVMKVIDYYKSRATYPAAQILEWTDKLIPEELSDQPGAGKDARGEAIEYASDREKWYAERCKALEESRHYQECIAVSEKALEAFKKFHYNNDVWFHWRIAQATGELGDKDKALAILTDLLKRKKDWFVQHRVAEYLYCLGRHDDAWPYALDAALNAGDLEYKWELFLLMGQILQAKKELEPAKEHVLLSVKLRQEHDWKIPARLNQAVQDLGVDVAAAKTARDLWNDLKSYWKAQKTANIPQVKGKITSIVEPARKAGFIKGEDGTDYYFKLSSFQGPKDHIRIGLRVKFSVEKNPDPSKRDIAIYVDELNP